MDVFLSSIKDINRSVNKRMPNIHLKITIEKKFSVPIYLQVSFWGAPTHADMIQF